MKNILILFAATLALANKSANAQSCSGSPLFTQGKQFVYLTDQQNAFSGANQSRKQVKITYLVQKVSNAGGTTTANIDIVKWEDSSNPNAKPPSNGLFTSALCIGGSMLFIAHIHNGLMDMDDTTEVPSSMQVGDKIKDKAFTVTIPGKNQMVLNARKQTNVVAQENVTTPAGTFNCFKVAITTTVGMPAMGNVKAGDMTNTIYTWFAPSTGIIKSQMANNAFTTTLISVQ